MKRRASPRCARRLLDVKAGRTSTVLGRDDCVFRADINAKMEARVVMELLSDVDEQHQVRVQRCAHEGDVAVVQSLGNRPMGLTSVLETSVRRRRQSRRSTTTMVPSRSQAAPSVLATVPERWMLRCNSSTRSADSSVTTRRR